MTTVGSHKETYGLDIQIPIQLDRKIALVKNTSECVGPLNSNDELP